jgi:hypothetical protein
MSLRIFSLLMALLAIVVPVNAISQMDEIEAASEQDRGSASVRASLTPFPLIKPTMLVG